MSWRDRPQRCGACIDGNHQDCVIIVETGLTRSRELKKNMSPLIWRCKCWECDQCNQTKCLDCHRVGVEVMNNRCADRVACRRAKDRRWKRRKKEKAANE